MGTGTTCVVAPAIFDLDSLESMNEQLQSAASAGDDVSVDCSGVERISTNGIFLLLSAQEQICAQGKNFQVKLASEPLRQAIEWLGLSHKCGRWLEGNQFK